MSEDAKNSIFLWVATPVFLGVMWALMHYDTGPKIPDRWQGPALGFLLAANISSLVWRHFRKRKANVR